MALEYDLFLSEKTAAGEFLRPYFPLAGLAISLHEASPERAEMLEEYYGLSAKLRIAFRYDLGAYDEDDGYAGSYSLVRATMAVLKGCPADALLLFNGESPVLLRLKGKLVLNSGQGWWSSPARLGLVDLPYEMKELPPL